MSVRQKDNEKDEKRKGEEMFCRIDKSLEPDNERANRKGEKLNSLLKIRHEEVE